MSHAETAEQLMGDSLFDYEGFSHRRWEALIHAVLAVAEAINANTEAIEAGHEYEEEDEE